MSPGPIVEQVSDDESASTAASSCSLRVPRSRGSGRRSALSAPPGGAAFTHGLDWLMPRVCPNSSRTAPRPHRLWWRNPGLTPLAPRDRRRRPRSTPWPHRWPGESESAVLERLPESIEDGRPGQRRFVEEEEETRSDASASAARFFGGWPSRVASRGSRWWCRLRRPLDAIHGSHGILEATSGLDRVDTGIRDSLCVRVAIAGPGRSPTHRAPDFSLAMAGCTGIDHGRFMVDPAGRSRTTGRLGRDANTPGLVDVYDLARRGGCLDR
jgi:hypothetical protein